MSSAPDTAGLHIRRLTMGYGDARILHSLDAPLLPPGSVTALIGPNGAGKSTLLRGLAGLQAMRGEIRLDGRDLARLPAAERARHIVYLPQSLPARARLAVFEAVLSAAMAGRPQGRLWSRTPDPRLYAAVERVLERLHLTALADRALETLSGGQRQLVGMAQALVRQPRILLLDEPTSALDLRHQYQVIDTLRQETRRHGLITLMVLHDINLALAHADHVLVLHDGRLASSGPPADVIDSALLARVYGVHGQVVCVQDRHLVLVHGHLSPSAA